MDPFMMIALGVLVQGVILGSVATLALVKRKPIYLACLAISIISLSASVERLLDLAAVS